MQRIIKAIREIFYLIIVVWLCFLGFEMTMAATTMDFDPLLYLTAFSIAVAALKLFRYEVWEEGDSE